MFQVEPSSLERVINHLIYISEKKADEARSKADKVALAAAQKVADLDQEESPESVLLSSMTDEGSKHRTDREVVVPWLKFLWETYRSILELLHKNTKYDRLYHTTCEKAFKFCEEYKRTLEFRRLCEMLRTHLSNLQKLTIVTNKANKVVFEWTQETIDLHLKTRLDQLEVATSLELWNEGFRIVEDIYSIMVAGKKTPKPRVMATYYEKLTRIFWVSENYLFHAYAWFKYFCLVSESKKEFKAEDRSLLASHVLLSALIIPSFKEVESAATAIIDIDDNVVEKNQQIAMLLDFQANPTRQNLLADIMVKGIAKDVLPSLQQLYTSLEIDFNPLKLPAIIAPVVENISSHQSLHIYALPLQKVAVLRVAQQLSKVYSTIKIEKVKSILQPFPNLSYTTVEKIMINGVARKQLHARIDHANNCLRFGSIAAASVAAEVQVVQLGSNLNKVFFKLNDVVKSSQSLKEEIDARRNYFEECSASSQDYQLKSLERKGMIDELKQANEQAQQRKEESDRRRREEIERQRSDDLKKQLDIEREEREKQRLLQEDLRRECERLQAEIERYSSSADVEELIKMDAHARQAVLVKAKSDFLKAKDEQQRKLVEQAKRLDYVIRAQRIESFQLAKEYYEKQKEMDEKTFLEMSEALVEEARRQHVKDLEEKVRVSRMQKFRASFEAKFVGAQREAFEKELINIKANAFEAYREQKLYHARMLLHAELERQRLKEEVERQRREKEENDRIERENEEKLRKLRLEEEQRQRERESEEDKRNGRSQPPRGGSSAFETDSNWRGSRAAPQPPSPYVEGGSTWKTVGKPNERPPPAPVQEEVSDWRRSRKPQEVENVEPKAADSAYAPPVDKYRNKFSESSRPPVDKASGDKWDRVAASTRDSSGAGSRFGGNRGEPRGDSHGEIPRGGGAGESDKFRFGHLFI